VIRPHAALHLIDSGGWSRSARDFASGKAFVHPTGEIVHFWDDVWLIQTKRGAQGSKSINLKSLTPYLRDAARLFIAREWLSAGKVAGTVLGYRTAFGIVGRTLGELIVPSFLDLSDAHAKALHDELLRLYELGQAAVSAASQQNANGKLSPRDRRRILREAGALDHQSITNAVYVMNEAVRVVRSVGFEVDVRFYKPSIVKQRPSPIGGADPQKVLSADELAAIIQAAQQDVEDYDSAVRTITEIFAAADFAPYKRPLAAERVSRYLGLGGLPMESIRQIARNEGGRDPASLKKTIRNHLSAAVGEEVADQIMGLRNDLRHASGLRGDAKLWVQDELNAMLRDVDLSPLVQFGPAKYAEACAMYFGLDGHRFHSWKEISRKIGVDSSHLRNSSLKLAARVLGRKHLLSHARRMRSEVDRLRGRAVKACALQLLAVTFRRVAAPLLSLCAEPETRWVTCRGTRLFGVRVHSFKMWGDEALKEWVELPGFHGEVLARAIENAKRLTVDLRPEAEETSRDSLFIVPKTTGQTDSAVALSADQLSVYFFTNVKGTDGGLVRRREIPGGDRISIHFFRHTHLTHIQYEGASSVVAAHIAGNSPEMAATAYLAMGTDAMRAQRARSMERGAATGYLYDAVVRMGMEATGEIDETIPPGQLSLAEASSRLRNNPQILQDYLQGEIDPTPEAALRLLRDGNLVVNVTTKGGCALPASEGPCPASEDCPIGCDPERNAADPSCGCRWQVRTADDDVIAYYESNIAVTEAQAREYARTPGWEGSAVGAERRLRIFRAQHSVLLQLRDQASVGGQHE
jgi:hypothetical protein